MLQSIGSQRVGYDWVTELNWTERREQGSKKVDEPYAFSREARTKISLVRIRGVPVKALFLPPPRLLMIFFPPRLMQNLLWPCLIHTYNPIFNQNTWYIVYDIYTFEHMEKFENIMSDWGELKRHRSQRELFATWDTRKIRVGWMWWENKRRKRSGNLVISANWDILFWSTFMGSPVCWRPHLCLRQISRLALQIHIFMSLPQVFNFLLSFQLSTNNTQICVCPLSR